MDYRDIVMIAETSSASVTDALNTLKTSGLSGVMVEELTGEKLALGCLPVSFAQAGSFPLLRTFLDLEEYQRAALFIPSTWEQGKKAEGYIRAKFPDLLEFSSGEGKFLVLTESFEELSGSGILPDLEGLSQVSMGGFHIIYRPAPSPGLTPEAVFLPLKEVLSDHPSVKLIAPAGDVVAGYPEIKGLAELVKEADLGVVQVEFSRQLGAVNLNWAAYPRLISMHSVTPEEMLARKISRRVLFERMLRAARERSLRLLLWRPSRLESSISSLQGTASEVEDLKAALLSGGIGTQWPKIPEDRNNGPLPVFGASIMFLLGLALYLDRLYPGSFCLEKWKDLALFVVLCLVTGIGAWKLALPARLLGLLTAVFTATEASLLALGEQKRPWSGLIKGFLFALVGGLSVAAFFGEPLYMLRLKTFSGVKATLLFPAILVLFHDLKRRVHPESLSGILERPPLWGELLLLMVILAGAGITLLRSGNVQMVPGWEVKLRDLLERFLVARPRNKEFIAGYPSIMLWYYFRKNNLWPHYREVFRIGGTLAFSTMVNSFCHFHTRLYFTLWREFNGLWSGLLMGVLGVVIFAKVILPLWDRYKGVLMD